MWGSTRLARSIRPSPEWSPCCLCTPLQGTLLPHAHHRADLGANTPSCVALAERLCASVCLASLFLARVHLPTDSLWGGAGESSHAPPADSAVDLKEHPEGRWQVKIQRECYQELHDVVRCRQKAERRAQGWPWCPTKDDGRAGQADRGRNLQVPKPTQGHCGLVGEAVPSGAAVK